MFFAVWALNKLGIDINKTLENTSAMDMPTRAYIEARLHEESVSIGAGPLSNIEDATAPTVHRAAVRSRLQEYLDSVGKQSLVTFEETPIDVEAAKLSAALAYCQIQIKNIDGS